MPAAKRAADDTAGSIRPSKASKQSISNSGNNSSRSKDTKKAVVPASTFSQEALPLHVNITHTPPKIPEDDKEPVVPDDVGFIGTLTLVPSTFSTGSYGWKGNKKVTIELLGDQGEEKTKVEVMLSVNATVIGSKHAAEAESGEGHSEVDGGAGGYESDNDDGTK